VKPLEILGRARAPDGTELVLYHRDGSYQIRVDGLELMSSRAHGSEEALAKLACAEIAGRRAPRVLIGGLGLGYTLRAALDALPAAAEVTVVEFFAAVVEWGRGPLADLAGRPLDDARVRVVVGDVLRELATATAAYDAIVLDVDNGPAALTLESNERLYRGVGLASVAAALLPRGVLAVWSADPDPAFSRRLRCAGFAVRSEAVRARLSKGPRHTIFIARRRREAAGGER
jgi:spermidine synthase